MGPADIGYQTVGHRKRNTGQGPVIGKGYRLIRVSGRWSKVALFVLEPQLSLSVLKDGEGYRLHLEMLEGPF